VSNAVSFPALGTTAVVCVVEPGGLEPARAAVAQELEAIDRACSRFRPDSELSRLNAAPGRRALVGALLLEALQVAVRAAAVTDGLVDPTIGRTLRQSGYDRTFTLVRARRGCAPRFATVPGWKTIELDAERRTVRFPPGAELDLGATAKALAADRAARASACAAGCGVLVGLGGDIAVAGEPPPGGWPVRVADDHAAPLDGDGAVVSIQHGGLASSGTTVRRWRARKAELHHIVDPRTARPAATPWRTVTVAAATCVDANTASTAAVVLGAQAPAWLSRLGLPALLVSRTGAATRVVGWPED
jgi:thiamine biosynthesis lipoprotein